MKWLFSITTILILLITTPSFSLDYLDEINLIDNIIKSFDEEPENWYFGTSTCIYAKDKKRLKKAISVPYPEHDPNSILVINFHLNKGNEGSYINFEKPDIGFISEGHDDEFKKFDRAIKIQLYKKLKRQVGSYVTEQKESPKVESEPEKKKDGYL